MVKKRHSPPRPHAVGAPPSLSAHLITDTAPALNTLCLTNTDRALEGGVKGEWCPPSLAGKLDLNRGIRSLSNQARNVSRVGAAIGRKNLPKVSFRLNPLSGFEPLKKGKERGNACLVLLKNAQTSPRLFVIINLYIQRP
jgi:hypothetical protein